MKWQHLSSTSVIVVLVVLSASACAVPAEEISDVSTPLDPSPAPLEAAALQPEEMTSAAPVSIPAHWGDCPPGVFIDFRPLSEWFGVPQAEFSAEKLLSALEEAGPVDNERETIDIGLEGAARLGSPVGVDHITLMVKVIPKITEAAEMGASFLVPVSSESGRTQNVTALFDDGSVAFLSDCKRGFNEVVASIAQEGGWDSPAEFLREVVLDPDSVEAAYWRTATVEPTQTPEIPWVERDPNVRAIDPTTDTPDAVMESLDAVWWLLELPSSWEPFPASVCTKVPTQGWNECVPLRYSHPLAFLPIYVENGQTLEIWLKKEHARVGDPPLAWLGTISAEIVSEAIGVGDGGLAFYVSSNLNLSHLDDLIAQADSKTLFSIAVIPFQEAQERYVRSAPQSTEVPESPVP